VERIALLALSPVDGRYAGHADALRPYLSEFGLIRHRVEVEVEWLIALAHEPAIREVGPFDDPSVRRLRAIASRFGEAEALQVKSIEASTQHDVKAVEYFLKAAVEDHPVLRLASEFLHFACTSEDINNLAYALMLARTRDRVLLPALAGLLGRLAALAEAHADRAMLARTHGQPASPTTLGKEVANVAARLERQTRLLAAQECLGKLNGAVGNYNAHIVAYPEVDWPRLARGVVEALGLTFNPHTTQIEPHDWVAEFTGTLARIATLLIDFCRDTWGYVSLGYWRQAARAGEVGSSTMPHKVNPIDFENAEGNLGVAVALFTHFQQKLPISRWQRDLTDSTVLRNLGPAIGHLLLGLKAIERGLDRIDVDPCALTRDLEPAWEVLAEAVQTVMRRHDVPQPYEQLKTLTRGQRIDAVKLRDFITGIGLPAQARDALLAMTPAAYTGNAAAQARAIAAAARACAQVYAPTTAD